MGNFLSKSWNFNKKVFGGGYIKDMMGMNKGSSSFDGSNAYFLQGQQALKQGYGQAIANNFAGRQAINTGYASASKQIGSTQGASTQLAVDRGQQESAAAQQSLVSKGQYNSTVLENAKAGISGDVSRQIAGIDAAYSQMQASLEMGKAGALAQNSAQTGQLQAGLGAALAGVSGQQAQLYAQTWKDPNEWLYNLMGIATTVGAAYVTGGGSLVAQQALKNQNGQGEGWGGN